MPEDPTVAHVLGRLCKYMRKRKLRMLDLFLSRGLLTHVAGNDFAATEQLVKNGFVTPGMLTHILVKLLHLQPKLVTRAVTLIAEQAGSRGRIDLRMIEKAIRKHRTHHSTERVQYLNHLMLRERVKDELFKRAQLLNGQGMRPDYSLDAEANQAAEVVVGRLETAMGRPRSARRIRPSSAHPTRRIVQSRPARPQSARIRSHHRQQHLGSATGRGNRSYKTLPINAAAQEMLKDIAPQINAAHPILMTFEDSHDNYLDIAAPGATIAHTMSQQMRPTRERSTLKQPQIKWTPQMKNLDAEFRHSVNAKYKNLRQAFCALDKSKSGTLNAEDLRYALRCLNLNRTNNGRRGSVNMNGLISHYVHSEGRKSLDYQDFRKMFGQDRMRNILGEKKTIADKRLLKQQRLAARPQDMVRQMNAAFSAKDLRNVLRRHVQERFKNVSVAFRKFDADRNGLLGRRELEAMMSFFGMASERAEDLLAELGGTEVDGVWQMDFQEFEEEFGDVLSAKQQSFEDRLEMYEGKIRSRMKVVDMNAQFGT